MFRARPMIAGLLLAIGSVLVLVLLPKAQSREVLAILLAALGGLYAGLGLAGQRTSKFALQAGVSAVFVILSIAGLWFSPWLRRHVRPRLVVRRAVPHSGDAAYLGESASPPPS